MLNSIRKTINYAKRNGIKSACYAALERLGDSKVPYVFNAPSDNELIREREEVKSWKLGEKNGGKKMPFFSILVPCYNTPVTYFKEMVSSVLSQTYPDFELILADASKVPVLKQIADEYSDHRIRYVHLEKNSGISENTNKALELANGDYCALLDHDDLLSGDALYHFAKKILGSSTLSESNYPIRLLYSDEDKCDGEGRKFYEPHIKPDYNFDYLLSNNYICHFTAVRTDILKEIKFREYYDGAQDFDMILRVCMQATINSDEKNIVHIPRVLYHWRCHNNSTAVNPESKSYAYNAGRRNVEDNLNASGIKAEVTDLPHVGFYRVSYPDGIFKARRDIGVVGGTIYGKSNEIVGGLYKENGEVMFKGLHKGFSGGFQHRAVCQQDAEAVDLRCMKIRKNLRPLLKEVTGLTYLGKKERMALKSSDEVFETTSYEKETGHRIEIPKNWDEEKIRRESIRFCKVVRKQGYKILWDPMMKQK